ncbi:MAG TPA: hypothetical protein VN461_21705 [Vicinamibacteria bacterium]|jgi:hypothetical protein|nr:hypothetical protein [Vicinamibacteria bacterium]
MKVPWSRGVIWGLVVVSGLFTSCSRKATEQPKQLGAVMETPAATPEPSVTAAMLMKAKLMDEDYMKAIAILEAADVNADVEQAVKSGDHRLFGLRGSVLEAPGVEGDRQNLPKGCRVVAVAGTSDNPGTKYQQRFQMLTRLYAAKYNPLLLSRVR